MGFKLKEKDCVICLEKSSIILLEQEQDLCKGVPEDYPIYSKFCISCKADYYDSETYEINQRIRSQE